MTEANLSVAAERMLEAAMRLFAQNGYDRTTVGQIQQAAGLTFGSGAMYKHFASKEAILAEGIERFVESSRSDRKLLGELDDLPIELALATIAQHAMSSFARDSDALRIVWRDLEQFPELQEKVRTARIRATFDDFSTWLGHQADLGRLQPHDSQAVAAVALGSLVFFQILQFLMHDTPAGLDQGHFVATWTELFTKALV